MVLGSGSHGNRRKSGAIILRIFRFPRLQTELKPRPSPLATATRLLQCPHVIECTPRRILEMSILSVITRKDQCVENGFGPTRLSGLAAVISFIAIKRLFLIP